MLDADFRVESDGNANMFNVGGGTNTIGMGIAPDANTILTVKNTSGKVVNFTNGSDADFYVNLTSGVTLVSPSTGILAFGTSNVEKMRIDAAGHITSTTQSAFLARPASEQSNLPINTDTTIVFGTEIFDQNADFASNTFTAPVAGRYQLSASVQFYGSDSATAYMHVKIITSNRAYQNIAALNQMSGDPAYWTFPISVLADMDASDTAYVMVAIPNTGTAQVDVTVESFFSGFLAC